MYQKQKAVIIGKTADIGNALFEYLAKENWDVYGTFRTQDQHIDDKSFKLDLRDSGSVSSGIDHINSSIKKWNLLVFVAGTMNPIGPFEELDFSEFRTAMEINFLAPLEILRGVLPSREIGSSVVFLAGGGTNSTFDNYSAYALSKVSMIKMVELLNSEINDVSFFSIGPGYVRTKIHLETLEASHKAGENLSKTISFLESSNQGTEMSDIIETILWCINNKDVASGRNFSVVHDQVSKNDKILRKFLFQNPSAFKLRRNLNDWKS
jgi:NADP-dependent 3-hydroxy acid dehydrogenase YdfG